jgi:hypothetical protein
MGSQTKTLIKFIIIEKQVRTFHDRQAPQTKTLVQSIVRDKASRARTGEMEEKTNR